MPGVIDTLNRHRCFGGELGFHQHDSRALQCRMRFSLFLPQQCEERSVPLLWWLSGLTCSEQNFALKAGAFAAAARAGMAIIAPDTSPRGADVADDAAYDLGQGASFYLDATQSPWIPHFRMYSYITRELQTLIAGEFPVDASRQGIFGHSMGGHGALVLGLRNPTLYRSMSAFAPIVAPSACPWGQKAFSAYLGADRQEWEAWDTCQLLRTGASRADFPVVLVDQGESDQFLQEQLQPERLAEAARDAGQALDLRMHPGYDHSYFFISSFIADHIRHHAMILAGA